MMRNGNATWKWVLGMALTLLCGLVGAWASRIEETQDKQAADIVEIQKHCASATARYDAIQSMLVDIKQSQREMQGLLEQHILGHPLK